MLTVMFYIFIVRCLVVCAYGFCFTCSLIDVVVYLFLQVFVMVNVSVQYEVIREKVYDAHYSLQNAQVRTTKPIFINYYHASTQVLFINGN